MALINLKNIDKIKYEEKINVLGKEIRQARILILALHEMIEQSNATFAVYEKYYTFFSLVYYSFYNEIIHAVSRLHDTSRDSLSIIKMLNENIEFDDDLSANEKKILDQIQSNDSCENIKVMRDKLGKAHLDGKVSINPAKQKEIYERHKIELNDITKYINLLVKALEILSQRLDQSIAHFLLPNTPIRREIREMFEHLSINNDELLNDGKSLGTDKQLF